MIKLNAGFSRKVGEANYSSRGASVNLELELESSLVSDPEKMHEKIRALFTLARKAVDEDLKNGHAEAATKSEETGAPPAELRIDAIIRNKRPKVQRLALKYGRDTWTPAMQAGITKRPLTFRQIFTMAGIHLAVLVLWRLWRPESSRFRKVA